MVKQPEEHSLQKTSPRKSRYKEDHGFLHIERWLNSNNKARKLLYSLVRNSEFPRRCRHRVGGTYISREATPKVGQPENQYLDKLSTFKSTVFSCETHLKSKLQYLASSSSSCNFHFTAKVVDDKLSSEIREKFLHYWVTSCISFKSKHAVQWPISLSDSLRYGNSRY